MQDLLKVMGLYKGATVREVKVRYTFLARQLHSTKHDTEVIVMMLEESVEISS